MSSITDLSEDNIYNTFDMLDVDGSGMIDFDEFYLLICILIAIKDHEEKYFIYRHSRTVFDLLDADGSGAISGYEFERYGFLLNFQGQAVKRIFHEFDVSGDQELDYKEFRMFAMACVDKQNEIKEKRQKLAEKRNIKKKICPCLCSRRKKTTDTSGNISTVSSHPDRDSAPAFQKLVQRHILTQMSRIDPDIGATIVAPLLTTPTPAKS